MLRSTPPPPPMCGGVAIICKNGIICKMKERNAIFESFEFFQLDVVIDSKRVSIFPIYRPESSATTINVVFKEFPSSQYTDQNQVRLPSMLSLMSLLEVTSILSHHIIFLEDFNIHLDEKNNSNSMFFL